MQQHRVLLLRRCLRPLQRPRLLLRSWNAGHSIIGNIEDKLLVACDWVGCNCHRAYTQVSLCVCALSQPIPLPPPPGAAAATL